MSNTTGTKSKSSQKGVRNLSLKEAAVYLGIGDFRMRKILTGGLVEATKVKEGNFDKWYVSETELDKYKASRGKTKDGRKTYKFRASDEELVKIETFLKELEIEVTPQYQPKPKK